MKKPPTSSTSGLKRHTNPFSSFQPLFTMRATTTSRLFFQHILWAAAICLAIPATAQTTLFEQNFSTFPTGRGISGNDALPCATAGTGPSSDGIAGQTISGITWVASAPPAALPDECSFIKIVAPSGNNRLHAKNLRGLEGCFRISNIPFTGYQAVVSLDLGIHTGTMEAGDSAIVKIYVDGSATPSHTQRYGFAAGNSTFSTTYASPMGSPFVGSFIDVEVCFRSGDASPAVTGAAETWYLDNIKVTGIACATVVNFAGETDPCVGTTESYSIVSPPANHSFSWSLVGGGGSITPAMNGLSASVNWTGAGAKIVRVTAIDLSTGCISEHDYNITVRSGPVITSIADLGPFCPGVNLPAISLSTTPINNSVGFSWTGGASIGIPDGSDNSFPFEIPAFTTGNAGGTVLAPTISITATDNLYGCAGTAEQFTVTVNPAPDLVLDGTPAVCSGSTFNLGTLLDANLGNGEVVDQNSVASLGFLVYTMQPYIPANQLNDLMVAPMTSTTYYFVKPTLGGCLDDLAVLLEVQGPVTLNSISADEVICAGDDASFTVSATNAGDGDLLYQWEVNDGMGFVDLVGATTATLNITGATFAQNGYQYQVKVSTSACPVQTSSSRTLTVKPRPALQATINGVTVTDNYDGVDDTGSFTVCNSVPNNISINAFTDLNGVMAAGQVKVLQEVMLTNVAVPFCTGCVALLSSFTGAMGSATLVDPSMPGTLVLKFRTFYDDNNSNTLDAGDCAGDWVIYTITVGNIPNVSATTDLPFGGGIYATCSDEDFTITIDGTGNPVGTTYSADWSLSPVSGTPDLMLVSGTVDFVNNPTTASTSTTISGSFINPAPNVNSIQISLTITATTPDGCTNTFPMVIYLRPEISVTGITGLPATVCSGEMTPVANVAISLPSGTRSITWAWSGTDITATPATGGPDNSAPFQVGATTLLNNSGDPRTATLTVTPNRTYATPVAQQCPGEDFEVMLSVEPGPLVSNQSKTICSDAPSDLTLGASTNLVAAATYNITSINDGGLTESAGTPTTGTGFLASEIFNDAWTNETNANVDVVYTIVPVSAAGCIGPAFTVTLTIQPEPVVPFQSGDMACSDVAINVTLGNSNPFVSAFNITNIDANGLTASAGNPVTGTGFSDDEIEDDAWTNTTGSPVNVIYTVVPISLNGCPGDFFTVTVQIKPEPVGANTSILPNICSDEALDFDLLGHVPGAANFTYTVASTDPVGVPPAADRAMASSANITDTYTNLTTDEVTITYTVTPISADGCVGEPFTVTVVIEAEPVVANQTATACSDANINVTLGDDVDGPFAVFYNVTGLSAAGLTPNPANAVLPNSMFPVQFSSNTELANHQYTNLTNGPLDVIYTIVPLSDDGCEGDAFTVTVTISPEPVVANVSSTNICSDDPIGYVLPATDNDGLSITEYDITASVDMDLIGTATEGSGITDINAIAGDSYTNLQSVGRTVVYTITPYAGDCVGAPFTVTFNIRAEPVLSPNLNTMVCSDAPISVTLAIDNTAGFQTVTGYDLISVTPDAGLVGAMSNAAPGTNLSASAIAADVWTNTTTGTLNVVYRVAPRRNFGCLGDEVDIIVMIKPEPVVGSVTATAVCSDSPTGFTLPNDVDGPAADSYIITDINTNGLTASAGSPPIVFPTGNVTNAEIADDAWTNNSGATVNVVYTIVPVSADGCKGDPFTVTVPVQAEPLVLAQTKTICSDEPVALLLGNSVLPPSVSFYQITAINPNGLTPGMGNAVPAMGLFNTAIQNDTWTNLGTTPVDVVYLVIPTGSNGCVGTLFAVTITVNPEPIVDDQTTTVCSDDATGITLGNDVDGPSADSYVITGLVVDGGLTPALSNLDLSTLPVSNLLSGAINADSYKNETNGNLTVTYTVVPVSADDCQGDPFTVTVTVKPEPVVANLTDGVCSDDPIGVQLPAVDDDGLAITSYDITATVAMGLVGSATTGMGITDVAEIAADEFTNNTGGPLDVVYTVTPYADGCAGTPFTITVTISPEPTFSNVPTINVCSDDALGYTLPATSTNGLPLTTFNISAVVAPNLSGTATTGTNLSDLTAIALDSFTNLTNGGLSVVYTVTPFSNGCQGADFTITFNIRAEPVLNPNLNTMVCSDAPISVTLAIDNTTGFQTVTGYDLISVTPDAGLVGAMSNAVPGTNLSASAIAADVWTNTTTGTLNVVYRVAPRRNSGCLGNEVDIIVMIKPEPVVGSVTATAVCSDSPTGFTLPNDVDGPAADSYIITDINTGGLTASAGSPPVVFPTGSVTNAEIADDAWTNNSGATVNVVYTIVPVSADGCKGDPFTVTVPVQAEPIVLAQTKTVCSDVSIDLLLGNSVLPPSVAFYQITAINPNGLTPGVGNAVPGNGLFNTAIQNDTWTNTTSGPVDVVYLVIPYGSNGCVGNLFSVTITVNPEPVVAPTQSSTVCSDGPSNVTFLNSLNVPSTSYNVLGHIVSPGLTPNPGNLNLSVLPVNGLANSAIASDSYNNVTNVTLPVFYLVAPVSSDGCSGDPYLVQVDVKPEPVVTAITDGVCSDVAIGIQLPAVDDDGLAITTYDITASVAMGLGGSATTGMGITDVAEIAADVFTNNTTGPLDVVYTVTPYSDFCAGTPFTITVTISPEPLVSNVPSFPICSGDVIGYSMPANSVNMLTLTSFDISAVAHPALGGTPTTGMGLAANAIAGDIFTNLTNTARQVVYTITPYSNGCAGTPFTVTVSIRPEPVMADRDGMACSDVAIGYVLPNMDDDGLNLTGADISAVAAPGLVGTPSTGTGIVNVNFIAGDIFTNTTSGPLDVVYTFTPYRLGCAGEPFDITITIKPEPVISDTIAMALCSDSPTGFTLPNDTDGPSAASYNITDIEANGLSFSAGAPATGTGFLAGEIANDAWTNATNSTVNVVYTIVPVSADGCEGDPFTVTVPIQPEPIVAFQTKTVCSDEALDLLLGASLNSTAVAFYQITSITPNGLIAGPGNATVGNGLPNTVIQNDTWTNTGNLPVNVNYVVIPWGSNGCQGNPFGVTITVNPEPVVDDQTDMDCSDAPIGTTLGASSSVAAATYNITDINSNGLTASAGSPAIGDGFIANVIEDDAWTNTTNAPVDVIYTVVPVSGDLCKGDPFTVTVTIQPEPVVAGQTLGVCSDEAIDAVFGDDVDGPAAASYIITAVSIPGGLTPNVGNLDISSLPLSGLSATAIEGDIYTNATTDPLIVEYTVVPVSADGCKGDPFTISVTISAEPDVADQIATVCSDEAIGVILNDDPDGPAVTSYSITVTNNGGLTASVGPTTGSGFSSDAIESDAWTNTGTMPVDVEYTIVPTANGCEGDPFTVTVTINPEPVVDDQNGMACSDVAIGITLGASTSVAAATYNITSIDNGGLTASAGTPTTGTGFADSEIANDAWTNTTGATVNVVYTVVPVSNEGCEGNPFTVTVMIKSEPVVINQAQAVCSDVPTGLTLGASTNSTTAATYNITDIQTNGLMATAGAAMMLGTGFSADVIADDAWRNVGLTPLDVVYTVEPVSADGCKGDAFTVTITVSPEPVLNAPISPVALCSDELLSSAWSGIASTNAQTINFINVTSVTFSSMSPNFIPNPGNAAFPANAVPVGYFNNDSYTNLTGGGVTVSYTVVGVTPGGCASDPVVYQFQIRAEPVLNPDLDKTICSGGNTDLTLSLDPTIGFQTPNGFVIDDITVDAGLIGEPGNVADGDILTSPYLLDDIWTNDTDGPLTVTYSIRPRRANGCFGDVADVVVTVEPTPVASLVLTYNNQDETINADNHPSGDEYELTICSGENLAAVGATTVAPTPGRDLWVKVELNDPADALGLGAMPVFYAPLSQLAFDENIVNTTMAPYVISATITPFINFNNNQAIDAGECEGESFGLIITVNPEPVAVATPSDTEICDDGSFTVGLNTNGTSVAADQYKVTTTVSDPGLTQTMGDATIGGTVMLAGPTNTISGTFSNATTSTQTVTYSIVPVSADGCEGEAVEVVIEVWARPSAAPTPEAICRGTIATIDPGVTLGSAAIMSYKWTYIGTTASNFRINGGGLLNPLSPTGTMFTTTTLSINTVSPLATTGLIGFELVVTDANGCTSEPVEVYIEVKNVPNPGTNGSFGPVCETFGNVNLTSLLGGTPQPGGTWTAGMSNPAGGSLIGPNFNPAGSVGGTYVFTYTIDNGACPPQSATVTVIVQPNANAGTFDITADNDVCAGEPSFNLFDLLNDNSYDLGGSWSELSSSGAVLNAATGELNLSTALPGNYTFRYLVTVGPTACPNPTDFEDVILNIIAPPAANPILGNVMPCINSTANYALTTPNTPGVTYAWSLSGGGTLTSPLNGNTATVNWGNTPGTYTLTLTETRLGCETVNTLTVEVTETVADFNFTVGSMDGMTINFTDASTGGAAVWIWNFGDSNSSSDQNPSHTFSTPGQYTVCLDVIGACGADQYCEVIDVVMIPQTTCDTILLTAGLNIISTDVVPADSSCATVFSELILAGNLVNVIGIENGLLQIFDPAQPPVFNTLTHIKRGFGYLVRVNNNDTLVVCGDPIDPALKIALTAGLNIVGYIPQASTTPQLYFDDLITANNLVNAIGIENGLLQIFDPAQPPVFNTLTQIRNGYGYLIRVNNSVSQGGWLLPEDEVEVRNESEMKSTDRFTFVAGYSNLPSSAVGKEVTITDAAGKVHGAMRILENGLLMTTPLFGDDSKMTHLKGIPMGERLFFQFNGQRVDIGYDFLPRLELTIVNLTFNLTELELMEQPTSEWLSAWNLFPNPFTDDLVIEITAQKEEVITISIFDGTGRMVQVLAKDVPMTKGSHRIIWDAKNAAPGVYLVKLTGNDGSVETRHVVRVSK